MVNDRVRVKCAKGRIQIYVYCSYLCCRFTLFVLIMCFSFLYAGLGREYALAFAERGASVLGNVKVKKKTLFCIYVRAGFADTVFTCSVKRNENKSKTKNVKIITSWEFLFWKNTQSCTCGHWCQLAFTQPIQSWIRALLLKF